MRIGSLTVKNFKAIEELTINFSGVTTLIGENNAGKSSVLSALSLFFDPAPRVNIDLFHKKNTSSPIEILIKFVNLTPHEMEKFSSNINNNQLDLARIFKFSNSKIEGKYYVLANVFEKFNDTRDEESKAKKRDLYKNLQNDYPDLPPVRNAEEINQFLEDWETKHPERCSPRYVSGFRGFPNVGSGQLREKTELIYVAAVKDTAEELGNEKSSPVKNLLNTLAKQTIENSEKFKEFKEQADKELARLTSPEEVPELKNISNDLTGILSRYYKGSELKASWSPVTELPVAYPKSELTVIDNGYDSPIENVGHGLQRAIFFSVLEYMATKKSEAVSDTSQHSAAQSDIIIVIEEPEVFQHPIKQRLFRDAFNKLSEGFSHNTGIRIQIVFSTHSSLLVDMRDFDQLVLMRRDISSSNNVKAYQAELSTCAEKTAHAKGVEPNIDIYKRGLHIFTSVIAEGFFAKKVFLVEGAGDVAFFNGYFKQQNRDPYAEGIHIVDAVGKTNFDKPITIFTTLGVPIYCLFDNDSDKRAGSNQRKIREIISTNRIIQTLLGHDPTEDWPAGVKSNFTAFDGKIESYIRSKVGDEYFTTKRENIAGTHNINQGETLKNPSAASAFLGVCIKDKMAFPELDQMIDMLDKL